MPHVTLKGILGKPSHHQLKQLKCKLTTNLMAVPCPWGHNKGHLPHLQDPALYLQHNSTAFTIPAAALPAYHIIVAGETTAKHKEQCANNISACKAWSTYMILHTITRDQFAASIDDIYYAALDNPTEGLDAGALRSLSPTSTLHETRAANLILTTTSAISTKNQGIDPNLPLAIYTRKQEECQIFVQDTGMPISKEMMVTTGAKHALNCGNMTLAWQESKRRPLPEHMWNNWKDHWTATFAEMHDINRMTSGDSAFSNQAAAQEIIQAEK
jgi:hypothetical protein